MCPNAEDVRSHVFSTLDRTAIIKLLDTENENAQAPQTPQNLLDGIAKCYPGLMGDDYKALQQQISYSVRHQGKRVPVASISPSIFDDKKSMARSSLKRFHNLYKPMSSILSIARKGKI